MPQLTNTGISTRPSARVLKQCANAIRRFRVSDTFQPVLPAHGAQFGDRIVRLSELVESNTIQPLGGLDSQGPGSYNRESCSRPNP